MSESRDMTALVLRSLTSIVTTLRSAAQLNAFTQDINDLSFSFITPLRPEDLSRLRLDTLQYGLRSRRSGKMIHAGKLLGRARGETYCELC